VGHFKPEERKGGVWGAALSLTGGALGHSEWKKPSPEMLLPWEGALICPGHF